MAAIAARLGAELKFLDAESQTNERLRKQEDEMKKLNIKVSRCRKSNERKAEEARRRNEEA